MRCEKRGPLNKACERASSLSFFLFLSSNLCSDHCRDDDRCQGVARRGSMEIKGIPFHRLPRFIFQKKGSLVLYPAFGAPSPQRRCRYSGVKRSALKIRWVATSPLAPSFRFPFAARESMPREENRGGEGISPFSFCRKYLRSEVGLLRSCDN